MAKKDAKKVVDAAETVVDSATEKVNYATHEVEEFFERRNVREMIAYFPYFGAIVMYFVEGMPKTGAIFKHIKYSAILLIIWIVSFALLREEISAIISLVYLGLSIFFMVRAYMGKSIEVKVFDQAEEKLKEVTKK